MTRIPSSTDDYFAANMRTVRERRGWTQAEFSQRLRAAGLDQFRQATVSRVEKGERLVRLGEATVIAETLEMLIDDLMAPPAELHTIHRIDTAFDGLNDAMRAATVANSDVLLARERLEKVLNEVERTLPEHLRGRAAVARDALADSTFDRAIREGRIEAEVRRARQGAEDSAISSAYQDRAGSGVASAEGSGGDDGQHSEEA